MPNKFSFKQFQFDCEQQILTKNGSVVSLNDKAIQLLNVFLNDPKKVHTKSEILECVWADKFVSDQVVFQNISQLRALFGNDSIKTFVKKGYQWQLPIERPSTNESSHSIADRVSIAKPEASQELKGMKLSQVETENAARQFSQKSIIRFSVFLLVLISGVFIFNHLLTLNNEVTSNASHELESKIIQAVDFEDQAMRIRPIMSSVISDKLFNSPYSSWKKYASSDTQWLIATKLYSVKEGVAVRFHIQGIQQGWSDYILASNKELVFQKLDALLSLLAQSQYFVAVSDSAALAELSVLMNKTPNNEQLKQQLIKLQIRLHETDIATALVSQRLANEKSQFRRGLLFLLEYEITPLTKQWSTARQSIEKATKTFEQLQLPQLESVALINSAWVHLAEEEFRKGIKVLNQAASKARLSKEPLLEVEAHLIQSFMASKAGQTELMHAQLDLAKELLQFHQMSEEHYIPVQRIMGWNAKSIMSALPHYQKILERPFSPQYEGDFYIAAERVRDAFIEQRNWSEALVSIRSWQRPSFQSLSRSHIAFAQGDWQLGFNHANNAYQQAQIIRHKKDALDAALLLLHTEKNENQIFDSNNYKAFIQKNATPRWLSQNSLAIEKIYKGSN